ncbi:hypothetical protein GWK48_09350 [Metallosphaera tengchongensis]|uniref:DUF1404 domain-containing protein n=1 Tax=Metallosphaera tengchongensis TaxID=1532350 RepID=A0A6N0NUU0_9CREN|nr:hypothetical protein [Metallosphaera tengchongensis]QKR00556.1 hypothetical protein GWK48_09350 [Metallosphaera tengchongensis]
MNKLKLGLIAGFSILLVSIVVYSVGDPLIRLISYQGPVLSGGVLGWYTLYRYTPLDKYAENQDGENVPVASILIRRRAWMIIVAGIGLIVPWLTPWVYSYTLNYQVLFVGSFLSQFVGGFMIGYVITSLKFMERFILYSLGFASDLFFVLLLYIYSSLFQISQTVLLNDVLVLVYGVKLLEGIAFGLYVVRRINAI